MITIRSAMEQDQLAITDLVHSERLNPNGLDWRRFVVATYDAIVIGAVQLPSAILRNYVLGQLIGGAFALISGRLPKRLVILDRKAPAPMD